MEIPTASIREFSQRRKEDIQILSNLWQVGGPGLTSHNDAAVYLVRFEDKAILVDAGCGRNHDILCANISKYLPEDVQIDYLLLTHCHYDHTGGAEAIRNEYGCKIMAHYLDAVYLESGNNEITGASWYGSEMQPFRVDTTFRNRKKTLKIGNTFLTAHHIPFHSPGSLVYVMELGAYRVLFGQDVHGPVHPLLRSDQFAYQRSLIRLSEFDADILCDGHFGIFVGKNAVQRYIGIIYYPSQADWQKDMPASVW